MTTMIGRVDRDRPARSASPGAVYSADAPSAKQMIPPIASRPWLVTVNSRTNSTIAEDDEQQAGDVERQAAEADEREDEREGARGCRSRSSGSGARTAARRTPMREQDERDVRVGQQVEQRLERVHRAAPSVPTSAVEIERTGWPRDRRPSWPSALRQDRRRCVSAMPSTAPTATASAGRRTTAPRRRSTRPSRRCRPRASAIDVMLAIASLLAPSRRACPGCPRPGRRPARPRRCSCPGAMSARLAGERDERPGARRPAARGATHTIVGTAASSSAHDDLLRRVEAAARRVELDDDGRGARRGGLRDALLEVAGHDVVHDAGRRQDDDVAARPRATGPPGEQPDEPQQEREREQEPADATGHIGPPTTPIVTADASRCLEHQAAPRLELVGDGRDLGRLGERPRRACRSRGSRRAGPRRPPRTPRRGGPSRPSVVSSLSRPTSRNAGSKSATTSSAHSRRRPPARSPSPGLRWPPTPIDHRSCSRASPPARVRRIRKKRSPSRSTRYGITCLKDGSISIAAPRARTGPRARRARANAVEAVRADAVQPALVGQDVAAARPAPARPTGAAQASSASAPARRRAAPRWRVLVRARRPLEVDEPARRGRPAGRAAGGDRRRVRRRDRRAHRDVAAGQPGHVAPARRRQVVRLRPVRPRVAARRRHGLDERGRDDERQVADRGDHRRRAPPASSRTGRAPQAAASDSTRGHIGRASPPRPARAPTAGPRTGPPSPRRSRPPPGRPSGGRRRTAGWCASAARDELPLRARHVGDDRTRDQRPGPRPGERVERDRGSPRRVRRGPRARPRPGRPGRSRRPGPARRPRARGRRRRRSGSSRPGPSRRARPDERAGDRSADQPEAEERDADAAHGRRAGRISRPSQGRCRRAVRRSDRHRVGGGHGGQSSDVPRRPRADPGRRAGSGGDSSGAARRRAARR